MKGIIPSRPIALVVLLIQLALIVWLGYRGLGSPYDNSIETFAVAGTRAERDFHVLSEHFHDAAYLVVSISKKDGTLTAAQGEEILTRISSVPGIQRGVTLGKLFATLPVTSPTPPLPFFQAKDGIYTGYFQLEPDHADQSLTAMLDKAEALKGEHRGLKVIVAGEPAVNYYLNRSSLEVKERFFPLLIGIALLLLGAVFRSLKVLLVTSLAVLGALATTTGIMALMGQPMNLVTTLIPALVFVLAVAMQVHVLTAIAHTGDIEEGLRQKIKPNFLIALTTSIGFGSLITSQVRPIQVMGLYMALGVWLIFLWTHAVHLSLSPLLKLRVRQPVPGLVRICVSPLYQRLLVIKWPTLYAVSIILAGVVALLYNPTESNGLHYFDPSHRIRKDTSWLQEHITGGSQVEVLLERQGEAEEDVFVPDPERVAALEKALQKLLYVRHVLSISRFGDYAAACEEANLQPNLEDHLLDSYLSPDYYRIQLLVDSLDRPTYQELRGQIEHAWRDSGLTEPLVITGVLDRIVEIQAYLISSLARSLAVTVVAVVILLLLLLGRRAPLSALIFPNLVPLAVMALVMYLQGIDTTISSVMVFSVAFGIAVDDSIHLLHTYMGNEERRWNHRWRSTIQGDFQAISMTTLVLVCGFSVLATSSFLPTYQFGYLLSWGMVAALICDLVLLPAFLRIHYKSR